MDKFLSGPSGDFRSAPKLSRYTRVCLPAFSLSALLCCLWETVALREAPSVVGMLHTRLHTVRVDV